MSGTLEERVRAIITDVASEPISDGDRLREDLDCAEVDLNDIVIDLEAAFVIMLPDDIEDAWTTVEDVIAAVRAAVEEAS